MTYTPQPAQVPVTDAQLPGKEHIDARQSPCNRSTEPWPKMVLWDAWCLDIVIEISPFILNRILLGTIHGRIPEKQLLQ